MNKPSPKIYFGIVKIITEQKKKKQFCNHFIDQEKYWE